jgi:hypothetical protein
MTQRTEFVFSHLRSRHRREKKTKLRKKRFACIWLFSVEF